MVLAITSLARSEPPRLKCLAEGHELIGGSTTHPNSGQMPAEASDAITTPDEQELESFMPQFAPLMQFLDRLEMPLVRESVAHSFNLLDLTAV
jgi:hypothetical protein